MGKVNQTLLTAIDVGSAKTCALTAEITDSGLRYLGHGVCESRGSRKGIIVDLEKAIASVQKAVEQAEDVAGAPVERAVIGIAGAHIRGLNTFELQWIGLGRWLCLPIARFCTCSHKSSFSTNRVALTSHWE
jgi:cell division ATPase FtsA